MSSLQGARGLDHLVHAVADLDAAGRLYERLGFTVGTRNVHPWGTHNRVVQLPGFFIELLTVGEPEKLEAAEEHDPGGIAGLFGGFSRRFLAVRQGLSMLVLESGDARGDVAHLEAAGIALAPPLHFQRQGRRPDGTVVEVAFSLAFAARPATLEPGFFTCQQHRPENFWNPALQAHACGARAVHGVVLVSRRPDEHAGFLATLAGRPASARPGGLRWVTPRGDLEVVTPETYADETGLPPPPTAEQTRLVALRLGCADLPELARQLEAAGVPAHPRRDRLVVDPATALGAALVFEPLSRA